MGRQFRRRRSGDPISLNQYLEDGGGWEINHAALSVSSSKPPTDEHMTALVNACTNPDFHDSKNLKANGGTAKSVASHSAENVGHTIKRSLSFLELPSELFNDDFGRSKIIRRRQTMIGAGTLILLFGAVALFGGSAEEEVVKTKQQREVDFGDHKKSLSQVAHSTEKYLQKSEIIKKKTSKDGEDEADEARDRPLSNRVRSQNPQMQQYLVDRDANKDLDEEVRDEDRENFVNAHKAQSIPEVVDTSRPLRAIPQDAQIRAANVMGPPIRLDDVNANLKFVSPVTKKYDPASSSEIPLFWEMSGGNVGQLMRNVLSCRDAIVASGVGAWGENGKSGTLQEVNIEGRRYVNVDTNTVAGLRRAKDLGLASSDLADVIFTPLFHPALNMFDASHHKARAFSILRHPIERSINTFLTLQENNDPAVAGMSLLEYAQSPLVESNWMVRTLSGKMNAELTPQHLDIAQEILTKNFIVGLHDDRYGSLSKFEKYFGWGYNDEQAACRSAMLQEEMNRQDMAKQMFNEGGEAIELLWKENDLDIQLYDFADALYKDQAGLFSDTR